MGVMEILLRQRHSGCRTVGIKLFIFCINVLMFGATPLFNGVAFYVILLMKIKNNYIIIKEK